MRQKKRYKSKKNNKLGYLIIFFAGLITMSVISNILDLREDEIVIYFPTDGDFPNPDQGKISLEFRFPDTGIKVGEENADILVFLDSNMIPDLKILYNQNDKKISAGIPLLITEEIIIFDGNTHLLEYEFNRKQKKQSIYLDKSLLASGEFNDELNAFTSYAIYRQSKIIQSSFPLKASFE